MSAVSFAFYIFVSGRVATQVPAVNKSLYMTTSAMVIIMTVFSPSFLYDGAITDGLWKYGLPLGLLGIVIPVLFFSIGVPKLGSGLGAILGAAELSSCSSLRVSSARRGIITSLDRDYRSSDRDRSSTNPTDGDRE